MPCAFVKSPGEAVDLLSLTLNLQSCTMTHQCAELFATHIKWYLKDY